MPKSAKKKSESGCEIVPGNGGSGKMNNGNDTSGKREHGKKPCG
jgi:hypothetical protein